jgi:hypothetical protein
MNRDTQFSDEFLNAFVDDEITFEEKSVVYACLSRDEAFNRRVCELRKLHDLIQLAYKHLSPPSPARPPRERHRSGRA